VRFNKLLAVMGTSLVDLQRAIRGEILLSDELDKCVSRAALHMYMGSFVPHPRPRRPPFLLHFPCTCTPCLLCTLRVVCERSDVTSCPSAPLLASIACFHCLVVTPCCRMYTCLLNNQVPKNWEAAAYPSLKPLASWVKDFHARIVFMRDWLQHGQPSVFWMSGFFFPQVRNAHWDLESIPCGLCLHSLSNSLCSSLSLFFLRDHPLPGSPCVGASSCCVSQGFTTGTLQNHARKYGVAIDALSFGFRVLHSYSVEEMKEEGEEVPEDGVLVHGLFMDGARWDRDARLLGTSGACCSQDHSPAHSYCFSCWGVASLRLCTCCLFFHP
jgi:hypothetical protein